MEIRKDAVVYFIRIVMEQKNMKIHSTVILNQHLPKSREMP